MTASTPPRLVKHIIRCYARLAENNRVKAILKENIPIIFRDKSFQSSLEDTAKRWLQNLFKALDISSTTNANNNQNTTNQNQPQISGQALKFDPIAQPTKTSGRSPMKSFDNNTKQGGISNQPIPLNPNMQPMNNMMPNMSNNFLMNNYDMFYQNNSFMYNNENMMNYNYFKKNEFNFNK
jgi:hypothetical protein